MDLKKRKLVKFDVSINFLKEKYIKREKNITPLSYYNDALEN